MKYLITKFVSLLFRLRFDIFIDATKSSYYYWSNKRIKNLFRSTGENFDVGRDAMILNPQYIEVGDGFFALARLRLEAYDTYQNQNFQPMIKIGRNATFNTDCHIGCINSIKIGDNVLFASRIFITDHFHGDATSQFIQSPPAERPLTSRGSVEIGSNAWIGEGVVVMPGVKIGVSAIIGANSVVTRDVPDYAVAAGNPCKVIRIISATIDTSTT